MSSLEEQFAQVLPSLIPRIPTKLLSERLLTTKNIARRSAPGYELNHQDLSSMICLWLLAAWFKPEVIFEAGTSHSLSLSTWIYYGAAEVHSIDITLQPWCAIQALSHLPTPDLTLHECCVTTIDFERIIRGRRALVFYDLHDVEERSLFEEVAIPRIFPALRRNAHLFAMHDVVETDAQFVPTHPLQTGPIQSFDGRWWYGQKEVHPFMRWVNQTRTDIFRPCHCLQQLGHTFVKTTSIVYCSLPLEHVPA